MEWCHFSILRSPCFPIVLLMFLECFSLVGLVKAMGVLFGELSKTVAMDSTDLGIALGLLYAVAIFTAPIVAGLLSRITHLRFLLVFGATIPSIGIVLASYATSNVHLFITFAIAGIGNSITLLLCGTALDRLAGESFNLLYTISTCGYSLGIVLLPFIAEELLIAYDWRGVLLILGGLLSNAIPCALTIRITPENLASNDDVGLDTDNPVHDTTHSRRHEKLSDTDYESYFHDVASSKDCDDAVKDTAEALLLTPSKDIKEQHKATIDSDQSSSPVKASCQKNRLDFITRNLDKALVWFRSTELYADPFSLFIFLSDAVLHVVYAGWHFFLIPHAFQRGISPRNINIMTLTAAVGNASVRPAIAFLTHKLVDPINIHLVLSVFNIISLIFDAFFLNFYVMLVTSLCSAAAIAGRAALAPLIIRGRVSSNSFPMALSFYYILDNSGILLGGYLSGLVADKLSSYDATFKLLAAIDVITFTLMLLPKMVKKPN